MNPLKILIIEDELITANDIQETLQKAGHQITAIAQSCKEALSSLKHTLPDLALIDIILEDSSVDGIATAKALLAQQQMPIIYLTANSEIPTVRRATETYPAAYLLKPFRHKELAIQVELAYYNYHASQETGINPFTAESLFLPFEGGHVRITKQDVLYIEAEGAYVRVFESDRNRLFTMNLGYIMQFFATPNFYRLSRSYLINFNYVERVERNQLFFRGQDLKLSFPEPQYKEIMQRLAVIKTPH
ncbi:response regulator [Runella sp. SP2]|uniref:response regulator n=1 Tax=Runella sp. SP2 TaxID=2268026 RepID=UPI000F084746|nr:response regulator [Runella sp. SP2]AYQ33971.1 DNA-binding response regulator [Runella sp. SP2]